MKISACIICRNEQDKITLALDSVAWCDDVVVLDSGSTDNTLTLTRNHPCRPRVEHHDWLGYGPQREYAAGLCRHDWVLMLDADEECSPKLQHEIAALDESALASVALFEMPRRNYIARRYLICWSPDYQSRLMHRQRVTTDAVSIPERRVAKPGFRTLKLRGPLEHNRLTPYHQRDVVDAVKLRDYAIELAQTMQRNGKKARWTDLLLRPPFTFVKYYILRGGFLYGRLGLVVAWKTTVSVILKYSVLYGTELDSDTRIK